jgi:hypothetical protein
LFLTRWLEFDEFPPPDIIWFERLWLGTLVLSAIITVTMFDWSSGRLGRTGAALLTSVRFGGSFLLMLLCTRRRSNLVRWVIAVPFNLTIVVYDVIRLPEILERDPILGVVVLRLALTFAATYMLFTPHSRSWFFREPPPESRWAG